MSLFDRITYLGMRLLAQALAAKHLEMKVTGLRHVPEYGPAVLVARHYHHLFDGVVLFLSIPRPIHILVTLDWTKSAYIRQLMKLATTLARWPVVLRSEALETYANPGPCQRKSAFTAGDINRHQRRALSDSVELLAEGRILVVFPEGYPNIDPHYTPKKQPEEFLPFKAGFAAIAAAAEKRLGARIPIIPTGFRYTKNSRWTARLNIGEAVYSEDFVSRRLIVKYLQERVAQLSGL